MDSESRFENEAERTRAFQAYFGLCSWLDHNVGQILGALDSLGLTDRTTVVYTSDHGDNVGARGLWGKSNLYQESVQIPLIMAGPDIPAGICRTPVSLLDLSQTIAGHFGTSIKTSPGIRSLRGFMGEERCQERAAFSEYHAVGAVSGAYMVRRGRWKYHHYVGFEPELFDLISDPEETVSLASEPGCRDILSQMDKVLRSIVDPEAANEQAFADQAELIARMGGNEAAARLGAPGATPPPARRA